MYSPVPMDVYIALYVAIHVGEGVTQMCPPHDLYTQTGEGLGGKDGGNDISAPALCD